MHPRPQRSRAPIHCMQFSERPCIDEDVPIRRDISSSRSVASMATVERVIRCTCRGSSTTAKSRRKARAAHTHSTQHAPHGGTRGTGTRRCGGQGAVAWVARAEGAAMWRGVGRGRRGGAGRDASGGDARSASRQQSVESHHSRRTAREHTRTPLSTRRRIGRQGGEMGGS